MTYLLQDLGTMISRNLTFQVVTWSQKNLASNNRLVMFLDQALIR